MDRYTEKHYGENGYYLICSGNCETLNCGDCGILDKIVDRLAAYEETGLEPEEINPTAKGRSEFLAYHEGYEQGKFDQYMEFCDGGISIDRLRELAQADREGRCVVLPCKKGDTVWRGDDRRV